MYDVVVRRASTRRLCRAAAALMLLWTAVGCERSANTQGAGAAESPTQKGVIDVKPAAEAPDPVSLAAAAPAEPPVEPPQPAEQPVEAPQSADASPVSEAAQPAEASAASEAAREHVAYYFHRTLRCPACLWIEQQAQETIEVYYHDELIAGTLAWRAVNIDEAENKHYESDFALQTQSLVLVEMADEQVARWKLLDGVWERLDDPHGFQDYVVSEVALFLGGG